ncbi:phosphatidylserine decarboxylase [Parerythrobacter aestuarii]|uniref:phosphatidylserine decarboxylase n=1 Tax=Parerythrobacter aestuarii TaxID=3020909 RepID=UPI0024DE2167|nr:phosphatidylserine decarboxylase [Parerythrobacter aestuarii]
MANDLLDNKGRGEAGWSWPAIHPEGRKYGIVVGIVSIVTALLAWETIAWPLAFLTLGVLAFFRDPERVVPQDEKAIVSPADGMVSLISVVPPPPELVGEDSAGNPGLGSDPVTRISIFMSVFDVHINRAPVAGQVSRLVYVPGKFLNADLDKASEENERQHLLVTRGDGVQIGFTQIAGLVARRIIPFVKQGDIVGVGQRIGLIRFGSRVDVYLPAGTSPAVILGQKMIAGETVLAYLGEDKLIEGAAQ